MFRSYYFCWLAFWFRQAGEAARKSWRGGGRVASRYYSWDGGWQGSCETEGEKERIKLAWSGGLPRMLGRDAMGGWSIMEDVVMYVWEGKGKL